MDMRELGSVHIVPLKHILITLFPSNNFGHGSLLRFSGNCNSVRGKLHYASFPMPSGQGDQFSLHAASTKGCSIGSSIYFLNEKLIFELCMNMHNSTGVH